MMLREIRGMRGLEVARHDSKIGGMVFRKHSVRISHSLTIKSRSTFESVRGQIAGSRTVKCTKGKGAENSR